MIEHAGIEMQPSAEIQFDIADLSGQPVLVGFEAVPREGQGRCRKYDGRARKGKDKTQGRIFGHAWAPVAASRCVIVRRGEDKRRLSG
ncbi:MAG: hypothetical protein OHK0018_04750 [Erythrobacter tepidarius]